MRRKYNIEVHIPNFIAFPDIILQAFTYPYYRSPDLFLEGFSNPESVS